jgi:hypothetical protein
VESFPISGLSKAAFFRKHRIATSCLSLYWKKSPPPDALRNPKPLRFLEVEIPAPPPDALAYRIVFPSGLRLEVPRPFQSDELSDSIRIVSNAGVQPHTEVRYWISHMPKSAGGGARMQGERAEMRPGF